MKKEIIKWSIITVCLFIGLNYYIETKEASEEAAIKLAEEQEKYQEELKQKEEAERIKKEQEEQRLKEEERKEAEELVQQQEEEEILQDCDGDGWVIYDEDNGCDESDTAKIKGNISSTGEKIYHVPGGAFYDRTDAEELFNTIEEAENAGYRKSKR